MSRQPLKSGEKVLLITFGVIFFMAMVSYGALEAMRMRSDKPLYVQRTHFDFSEEGKRGSEIYNVSRCNSCHKALRSGTSMGLDLDGLGSKRSLQWIEQFLRDPEKTYGAPTLDHGPAPKEAAYVSSMSPQNLHAIAVFLSELKADRGAADAEAPPEGRSQFIDDMVKVWAPDSWKNRFEDVRVRADEEKKTAAKNDDGAKQ
jgi:hypothetical protein